MNPSRTLHRTLVLAAAGALVATTLFAGEPHVERRMKIQLGSDASDVLVVEEADDMEIGETRQYFTDGGEEVLITRTETGREIEVDGKTIVVDDDEGGVFVGSHVDHHVRKIVERIVAEGEGDHRVRAYAYSTDLDLEVDPSLRAIELKSPSDRLLESGVLDDLDEAKRQEILEALRSSHGEGFHWFEGPHGHGEEDVRVIRIEKREIHERDDED